MMRRGAWTMVLALGCAGCASGSAVDGAQASAGGEQASSEAPPPETSSGAAGTEGVIAMDPHPSCRMARACCEAIAGVMDATATEAGEQYRAFCEEIDPQRRSVPDSQLDGSCESLLATHRETLTALGSPLAESCGA